jgi:hypothetical protein
MGVGLIINMFIFPESEFTGELLKTRFRVMTLPTEIVYPNYYTGEKFDVQEHIKSAYGYSLRDKFYPPNKVIHTNGYSFDYQCVIEVHDNYGDDGHVDYVYRGMVRIYKSEIPKTWEEYKNLISDFYKLKDKPLDTQLCFKQHFDWQCDMPWV